MNVYYAFLIFIACLGISLLFNLRGKIIVFSALGGAAGWFTFELLTFVSSDLLQYFFAAVFISIYSEILARLHKVPATIYLTVSLIPMVPGAGIYQAMRACISGDQTRFVQVGLHTLAIAGVLALGILLISTLFFLWKNILSNH